MPQMPGGVMGRKLGSSRWAVGHQSAGKNDGWPDRCLPLTLDFPLHRRIIFRNNTWNE